MERMEFSKPNILFISNEQIDIETDEYKKNNEYNRQKIREKVEPWLTALFQSEHLSLLIGSGLSVALTGGGSMMKRIEFEGNYKEKIKNKADEEAKNLGRGEANFEDDLRVAIELLKGYKIIDYTKKEKELKKEINDKLQQLIDLIIKYEHHFLELQKLELQKNEREIYEKIKNLKDKLKVSNDAEKTKVIEDIKETVKKFCNKYPFICDGFICDDKKKNDLNDLIDKLLFLFLNHLLLLERFLLSFSTRTATRDRLNIFTTNYDRFIEYGLDEAGILTLDRFIGKLKPIMRFHRIDLDYHYNPPGIRGEPRYVEGVVKLTKLHGSIDWKFEDDQIVKIPLPFGENVNEDFFANPFDRVVIYPNSAKALETTFFPYSELFRDFSTAICRPNSVLVTYGYGFGDSHINRIILDMLTIPSTHLVIISYDLANGRIENFIKQCNEAQLTLLIGNELGNFENLTSYYLPKPAIDRITDRQARLLEKRKIMMQTDSQDKNSLKGGTNESEF
ncbi:SIR2 family protein [Thermovirga sp.]|uniref:SIR2 family protein n=1 Tax=Thermovirga sp. TaxID=2699834 RepID=UPI0025F38551|nr:SIR2 family protein [Thermovirga sp.]